MRNESVRCSPPGRADAFQPPRGCKGQSEPPATHCSPTPILATPARLGGWNAKKRAGPHSWLPAACRCWAGPFLRRARGGGERGTTGGACGPVVSEHARERAWRLERRMRQIPLACESAVDRRLLTPKEARLGELQEGGWRVASAASTALVRTEIFRARTGRAARVEPTAILLNPFRLVCSEHVAQGLPEGRVVSTWVQRWRRQQSCRPQPSERASVINSSRATPRSE